MKKEWLGRMKEEWLERADEGRVCDGGIWLGCGTR